MKGQCGRRQIESFGDLARRQSIRPGLNQQAEHIKAGFLGKRPPEQ